MVNERNPLERKTPEEQSQHRLSAMTLQDAYRAEITQRDKDLLLQAKRNIATSDIPIEKRKPLSKLLELAEQEKGGRYALIRSKGVANDYLDGKIPDERLDFEIEFLNAWCDGKLNEFVKKQLEKIKVPKEEKDKLKEMFELASRRSNVLQAITASNLRHYYPMKKPEERLKLIENMSNILEAADSS